MANAEFYHIVDKNLYIFVRLTPKAAKDNISGLMPHNDGKTYLNIHVRAVPEKNQANKALIKFLAKSLKIAPSLLNLHKGSTSRFKQIKIDSDAQNLVEILNSKVK